MRPSWDLDPNPREEWQGVGMDATSNHSGHSSQRVPQGNPQEDGHIPHLSDPKAILLPMVAHVLQVV
jgi:hypothetical protein